MRADYFSFSGRLNRKPYWLRSLALYLVMFGYVALAAFVVGGLGSLGTGEAFAGPLGIVLAIVGFALFVAVIVGTLSLAVRRLHDRDKSGWWLVFFYVVPIVVEIAFASVSPELAVVGSLVSLGISIWFLVELGFLRGTEGPNRYGPDPLGYDEADAAVFA